MVESESGSISQVVSQGRRVPRPTRRVAAQSLSQSMVRSNSVRTSGGTSEIAGRTAFTWSFQTGSE
jgi:hypothetical protein